MIEDQASAADQGVMRTSIRLPASMHPAIKHLAIDRATTMGALIRSAIIIGLRDPAGLAAASMVHRRNPAGIRTTLDLPRCVHRRLKVVAAQHATSVQALTLAAILSSHPDLCVENNFP